MRVFHCMRSQKEPTGFSISCFHMLVAEHITFDVYVGIAIHGFLIAANSSRWIPYFFQMDSIPFPHGFHTSSRWISLLFPYGIQVK